MDEQSSLDPALSTYCLCTTVSPKAMAALLEAGDGGAYLDAHPWLAARELFESERARGRAVAIVFASGSPLELCQWAIVESIEVVELHRASWESRVEFRRLRPVHSIWSSLDSVFLKPGDDQLRRESLEPIAHHRHALDERHIRPYAICEAPAFMSVVEQRSVE